MTSPRSREALERELQFLRNRRLIDGTAATANNVIRWGGAVACVYFGVTRPFEAMAGKNTLANISVMVQTQLKEGDSATWAIAAASLFGVAGVAYGWLQRRLRKGTVERLQARIQVLEKMRDPQRSSSTLTPRGDTRQEDRL